MKLKKLHMGRNAQMAEMAIRKEEVIKKGREIEKLSRREAAQAIRRGV